MSRKSRKKYGSFPTTADEGIWARGDSPQELLEALGLGLYALMTDLRTVRPTEERAVSASGTDTGALVVAYLNQLLLLQQADGFIGRSISVRLVGSPPTALLASLQGERFEESRHPRKKEVKAVTLHQLEVSLDPARARVIVDI